MTMNSRKLVRYLGEVEGIYQQSVNLSINYETATNLIRQINSNPEAALINFDRNYINSTELAITQNHQFLMLELNGLYTNLTTFQGRPLVENDHMGLLALGEAIMNWSDRYTATVVAASMNVASHIQDTFNTYKMSQGAARV